MSQEQFTLRAHGARGRALKRLAALAASGALVVGLGACSTVGSSNNAGSTASGDGGTALCGSPEEQAAITAAVDGRTLKIGYTPPILSEFYTQIEKSAFNRMHELEECYGIQWEWSRQGALNDAHSGAEAIGIVQSFISNEFDAVFVCSAAPHATMQEIYAAGSEAGVNFYQFNSTEELDNPSQAEHPTAGLYTVSNIGYDDRWQSGYIAGLYLADALGGEGQVVQILGPSGSNWTKLRQFGFEAAISEFPGMTMSAPRTAGTCVIRV